MKQETGVKVMSWKPQVYIASESKWHGNGLAFETEQEAKDNARDLLMRWFVPTDSRAIESDETPNYRYIAGKLVPIETESGNG
jgi:hypothetical protein